MAIRVSGGSVGQQSTMRVRRASWEARWTQTRPGGGVGSGGSSAEGRPGGMAGACMGRLGGFASSASSRRRRPSRRTSTNSPMGRGALATDAGRFPSSRLVDPSSATKRHWCGPPAGFAHGGLSCRAESKRLRGVIASSACSVSAATGLAIMPDAFSMDPVVDRVPNTHGPATNYPRLPDLPPKRPPVAVAFADRPKHDRRRDPHPGERDHGGTRRTALIRC